MFSIPSSLVMSIVFLKVRYSSNHYWALLLCAGGITFSLANDLFMKPKDDDGPSGFDTRAIIGDIMVLSAAVMFAT